jgi:hypothetical protein
MGGIQVMCAEDLIIRDENDKAYLVDLASAIDAVPRQGLDKDDPEGSRVIVVSDTLARKISDKLREISRRKT